MLFDGVGRGLPKKMTDYIKGRIGVYKIADFEMTSFMDGP